MTNPNIELEARRARLEMAVSPACASDKLVTVQAAADVEIKTFRGSYLLYREKGAGMQRLRGSSPPRFRHSSRDSAETEAARLLGQHPESTFVILQEVGRVKLKAVDVDAATGCADDQTFAAVPIASLRKAAGMPENENG